MLDKNKKGKSFCAILLVLQIVGKKRGKRGKRKTKEKREDCIFFLLS
jgi:hypothetical protein